MPYAEKSEYNSISNINQRSARLEDEELHGAEGRALVQMLPIFKMNIQNTSKYLQNTKMEFN